LNRQNAKRTMCAAKKYVAHIVRNYLFFVRSFLRRRAATVAFWRFKRRSFFSTIARGFS
jgi:hypothetical protein